MNPDNQNDDTHCVDQLYQLFKSCDTSGSGLLGSDELFELLQLLQLDDHQTNFIITNLIGNDLIAKVDFSDFKEIFVSLLTQSQSNYNDLKHESPKPICATNSTICNSTICSSPVTHSGTSELTNDCNTEEYLRSIWNSLGLGKNGYLDFEDLYRVCEHIGMIGIDDDIIHQLFEKLDDDRDGRVSFDEFLQRVFQHGNAIETNGNFIPSPQPRESPSHSHNGTTNNNQNVNDSEDLLMEHKSSLFSNMNSYLISLDPDRSGYTDAENVLKLWESFGFSNSIEILKRFGFNSLMRINIHDLSSLLEEQLCSTNNFNSQLFQVSLSTFQYELAQLRINYEQTKVERDRLRISIAEANARVDLLAQDVDEHHAKLEESSQNKLNLLEKKYQEQIRSLEAELRKERETQVSQSFHLKQNIIKELSSAQEQETKLREGIAALEQENVRLEKEVQHLNQKHWEMQKMCIDLQKQAEDADAIKKKFAELDSMQGILREQQYHSLVQEIDSIKIQNKELKDHNDELLSELESMRQQLVSSREKKSPKIDKKHHGQSRSSSWLSDFIELDQSNTTGNSSNVQGSRALKRRGNDTSMDENSEDDSSNSEKSKRIVLSAPTHMDVADTLVDAPMEADDESMSQTISEGELMREIDALKDQLAKEIMQRDQLINDRDRMAFEIRETYEKAIKDIEEYLHEQITINKCLKSDIHQLGKNRKKFDENEKLQHYFDCFLASFIDYTITVQSFNTEHENYQKVKTLIFTMIKKLVMYCFGHEKESDDNDLIENLAEQMNNELYEILTHIKGKCEKQQSNDDTSCTGDANLNGRHSRYEGLNDSQSKEGNSNFGDTNMVQLLSNLKKENEKLAYELQLSEEQNGKNEKENCRLNNKCKVLSKLLSEISNTSL